jgi:L-ascorbate metabolism protein UlaG (beta-lactamase superfamily)
VAFLPIGGHFTMDLQEALKAVELIRPDVVVPIHYDTFPPIRTDAEEFRRQVEAHTFTRVRIMKPLDTWEVELPARQV